MTFDYGIPGIDGPNERGWHRVASPSHMFRTGRKTRKGSWPRVGGSCPLGIDGLPHDAHTWKPFSPPSWRNRPISPESSRPWKSDDAQQSVC